MSGDRRRVLKGAAAALAGAAIAGCSHEADITQIGPLKGNVRHAVARWTFWHLSLESLCQLVKQLGFSAIDLCGPDDWPTLRQYGIDSSMCNGAELNLTDGWCDATFHDQLIPRYLQHIDLVADAGYTNLVCFSGNARGITPAQGLDNAVRGLREVLPHAEARGVTLFMELFNSKIDHPDYMADNSAWGIALCDRLNSPQFRLLYDIYHMQINEGDVIRTIRDHHPYFGHFHTAGVPGRHEIDHTQELNYAAIAQAIIDTGFSGYIAQEFLPSPFDWDAKAQSLADAIRICDV